MITPRLSALALTLVVAVAVAVASSCGGDGATAPAYDPKFDGQTGLKPRLDAFKAALAANPPSTTPGNAARRAAITDWDSMLWGICVCGNAGADINAYVKSQWDKAAAEMAAPVTEGVKIWKFYNHGWVVKSATKTVAFDLLYDRPTLPTDQPSKAFGYDLPASIVNQMDVLMISHEHGDHTGMPGRELGAAVKARGGAVFYPRDGAPYGYATQLADSGITYQAGGVTVRSIRQRHATTASMAYEVTLPNGYRIVHFDGEFTSPIDGIKNTDVLLINNWANGSTLVCKDAIVRVMGLMKPGITMPGHMQELSHDVSGAGTCAPGGNFAGRKRYADMLDIQDMTNLPSRFAVLTWGESIAFKRP